MRPHLRSCAVALCGAASLSVAAVALGGAPAGAASYAVTNLDDGGAGSLRQAVSDADANPGPDQITFAAGLSGEISLTSGSIALTSPIDIVGPGALDLRVAGNATGSVFAVTSAAQVVISGLTLTNGGGAGQNSGGVYINSAGADVTIRDAIVSGNTGYYGGGISVYSGQLLVQDSRITGNTATGSGGGVATATSATLERVEVSANSTVGSGGGVFLNSGTLVVDGSTISGNTAQESGGIHRLNGSAQLTVRSSTIVGNTATGGAAGGMGGAAPTSLGHSIVAGNTPSDVSAQVDATRSLIGDPSGATVNDLGGNLLGVDPQLEALAFSGGPTRTHFPLPSSPVIDAGDPGLTSPPATDQRGARRVAGATGGGPDRIDIGAVEVVPMDDRGATDEDTVLTVADPGVLGNDNRGYTAQVVDQPAHGQVVLNGAGGYSYTPNRNFHGSDSFTYRLVGAGAPGSTSTVSIDVASVPDPFQLGDDTAAAVSTGSPVRIDVLANDSGDDLAISSVTQGQLGTVQIDGSGVLYTPRPGAAGADTFQYVATDGSTQGTATVTLAVTAAAAPVPPTSTTTTSPPRVLPATGAGSARVAALAASTIMIGAVLARAGRRRPSRR